MSARKTMLVLRAPCGPCYGLSHSSHTFLQRQRSHHHWSLSSALPLVTYLPFCQTSARALLIPLPTAYLTKPTNLIWQGRSASCMAMRCDAIDVRARVTQPPERSSLPKICLDLLKDCIISPYTGFPAFLSQLIDQSYVFHSPGDTNTVADSWRIDLQSTQEYLLFTPSAIRTSKLLLVRLGYYRYPMSNDELSFSPLTPPSQTTHGEVSRNLVRRRNSRRGEFLPGASPFFVAVLSGDLELTCSFPLNIRPTRCWAEPRGDSIPNMTGPASSYLHCATERLGIPLRLKMPVGYFWQTQAGTALCLYNWAMCEMGWMSSSFKIHAAANVTFRGGRLPTDPTQSDEVYSTWSSSSGVMVAVLNSSRKSPALQFASTNQTYFTRDQYFSICFVLFPVVDQIA